MIKKIVALSMLHIKELIPLVVDVFKEDPYYLSLCKGDLEKVKTMIRHDFRIPIEYCLKSRNSYGIMLDEKLVAFVLMFDYQELKQRDTILFKKVFANSRVLLDKIKDINVLNKPILFELLIGVSKENRRRGFASELLDEVLKNMSTYTIVADVDNPLSLGMYKKRKFDIDIISESYYLVTHHSSN